ncbi:type 2 periplasmic-binding domain-containing protein [Roseitranquillus sediminis]|uniref:tricarboxylate transporter n=1 Tax=Roseitranquillus sediminis TaxID=2809051 RepID=UPI001D0C82A7|nr:tricarboxylate transporter [Roseitranquillus sediminis]MBM9595477.1 tricarboxylate transporter [Roseitranquillus sediminis]
MTRHGNIASSLVATVATATVLAAAADTVSAQEGLSFEGKRVETIVPFGEGGGADTYSRYMVQRLAPKLAGEPTIVVRNIPGGGSVNGANWFAQNAETDGTHIAVASTSTTLTYAMTPDDPRIEFDAKDWNAFLASPMGRVIYVHEKTGIESIEDLASYDGELIMGVQSPTGSDLPSLLSLDLLGVEINPIFGTMGGDQHLAFERGEFTANADVASAYIQMAQPLVDAGTAVPLFAFGYANEAGEIERDPNFPDLPSFVEAYETVHGEPPSGPAFDAWKSLFYMGVMSSKAMVLPSGASDEVIAAYDAAAEALVNDPAFQEESGAYIGDYPQLTGEAARESLRNATTISDEARQWVVDWLNEKYDIQM